MDDPIFVRFNIPDTAPSCYIRYALNIEKDVQVYNPPINIDLLIQSD